MHTEIATLQTVVQRIKSTRGLDPSRSNRITTQLTRLIDDLNGTLERRQGGEGVASVNFGDLLRSAFCNLRSGPDEIAGAFVADIAKEMAVQGPKNDLQELVDVLAEFAFGAGGSSSSVRAQVKYHGNQIRPVCETEIVMKVVDLPEFLGRKLWDAVRIRRGEVSIVSEPKQCRVLFTLPIERRSATVLG